MKCLQQIFSCFGSYKDNKLGTESTDYLKVHLPHKFCSLPGLINEQVTLSLHVIQSSRSRACLGQVYDPKDILKEVIFEYVQFGCFNEGLK